MKHPMDNHPSMTFEFAMTHMTLAAMAIQEHYKQGTPLVCDVPSYDQRDALFYQDLDVLYTLPNYMARKCYCGLDHHRGDN